MGQRASPVGALHFDGVAAAGGRAARPGGPRLPHDDERARQGPGRDRRAGGGHRPGRARGRRWTMPGTRRQFGQAIAEFQGLQWLLADMAKDIQAARLLTQRRGGACWIGASAPRMACSMAKCFAGDAAVQHAVERGPDLRRQRLHPRLRGRAAVPRRQDHPDLRRHQPDPAHHHRARAAETR